MSPAEPGTPSSKDPLLTVSDVAARLKNSPRTIWRCIADKKIAVVRFGRSVRITEEALRVFIQRHCNERHIQSIDGADKGRPREKQLPRSWRF